MSAEQIWSDMSNNKDNDLSSLLKHSRLSSRPSKNPLQKIKQGLLINIGWCILISMAYAAVILYFHIWQVQLCIGLVLLFTLWALYTAWNLYRDIKISQAISGSVLEEMKIS